MSLTKKMSELVDELGNVGIVPVIKLDKVDNAEKLAKALRDGGINCAEVTFRAKGADEVIRRMTKAYPDMLVGAGTVLTCEQVDSAVAAGAKFCVAPGLNPKVVYPHSFRHRFAKPRQRRAVRTRTFFGERDRAGARTGAGFL